MQLAPTFLVALHLAGAIGFVVVVSLGTITDRVRRIWPEMMGCPMCFGVWGGSAWAAALTARGLGCLPGHWVWWVHDALAFAFAVSVLSYCVGIAHSFLRLAKDRAEEGRIIN